MNQLRLPTSVPTASLKSLNRCAFDVRSSSIRSRNFESRSGPSERTSSTTLATSASYGVRSSSLPCESSRSAISSVSQPAPDAALGRHALGLVAPAPDQVEERRGELVRADPRPLRDERGHERGLQVGGRLLLVLAVVPDVELAAVAPVHEVDEARAPGSGRAGRAAAACAGDCRPPRRSAPGLARSRLRRRPPPRRSARARSPRGRSRRPGSAGTRAERARDPRPTCSGGMSSARKSACSPSIVTSPGTDTGWPQARVIGALRGHRRGELAELLLPLVAPEPDVDVDHVVVGDRDPLEPVRAARTSAARSSRSSARRPGSRRPRS